MTTQAEVVEALEDVHDPHVPVSLRSMGMLAGVEVSGEHVQVEVCIPCMACPASEFITEQVRERVLALDGVTSVDVTPGFHLYWDRESVDPKARELLRTAGIQL
ncbi:MAG: DUF59 domain-containing protein [Streptosporangiales bacterium]|nr:DUF59 domain-containing protein [Streptosporangiales bacterium]